MEQTQRVRQDEINHGERVGLARGVGAEEHGLARLDIPVAIFAPEKAVKRGGGFAEFVFVQRDGDFADGLRRA